MKLLLGLMLVALANAQMFPFPGPGRSSDAVVPITVTSVSAYDTTTTADSSLSAPGINVPTGAAIAVWAGWISNSVTITDSAGNTFTADTVRTRNDKAQWWYVVNAIGASNDVVTLHVSGGAGTTQHPGIQVIVIQNVTALDVNNIGSAGFTNGYGSPSFTTTAANEIILLGVRNNFVTAYTAGSGYTIQEQSFGGNHSQAVQYSLVSSIQSSVVSFITWTGGTADVEGAVLSFR